MKDFVTTKGDQLQVIEDFICPLDKRPLTKKNDKLICTHCSSEFVISANQRPDLRPKNNSAKVSLEFSTPVELPSEEHFVKSFHKATKKDFAHPKREELRKRYGTKLQKEFIYYLTELCELNPDASILDLGCGNGGNKKFLKDLGFKNILSVDYESDEAEVLIDAHFLPFAKEKFDIIISTQTIEHFYNPFIAFSEMNRVLKSGGHLLVSGSFWESWHGHSCFHFTPHGFYVLCQSSNFKLIDLWSGWGFITSVLSHAITSGRFKKTLYFFQGCFDFLVGKLKGNRTVLKHRLKTSGSFGIYATKERSYH